MDLYPFMFNHSFSLVRNTLAKIQVQVLGPCSRLISQTAVIAVAFSPRIGRDRCIDTGRRSGFTKSESGVL